MFIMSLLAAAHWTGLVPTSPAPQFPTKTPQPTPTTNPPNQPPPTLLLPGPTVTRYSRAAESAAMTSARQGHNDNNNRATEPPRHNMVDGGYATLA